MPGKSQAARKELEALVPQLGGADRDLARVRIGVADYDAQDTAAAHRDLAALESLAPERRCGALCTIWCSAPAASTIRRKWIRPWSAWRGFIPISPWRLQALLVAANRYLIANQMDAYEPLYRACYETFPKDPEAAVCHWSVVWSHYLRRRADAADMLRAHLRLFPAAESASAALYFLGRLAEDAHDSSAARTYYSEIAGQYPNQYYAMLARDRLAKIGSGARHPRSVNEFLRSVAFTERARIKNFNPGPAAAARIERAKLLQQAGFARLGRAGAALCRQDRRPAAPHSDDQPYVTRPAACLAPSGKPDQSLHAIKSYAGGYLFLPLESAPRQFWTFAFPLPFRSDVETFSKQNGLDPFLVAGADPPGVGVQSQGGFRSRRSRTDPD